MKGIIIYEDYRGKEVVEAIKLSAVNYKCTSDDNWISELSGIRKESTQAYCDKDDTYDFETGALIALMKMCGRDKVTKACDELYRDDDYKNALQEMTENFDKVNYVKEFYKKKYGQLIEKVIKLEKEKEELHKNIDELFESDKYWKSEAGRLSFEKHRLEEENETLKKEKEQIIVAKNILYNKLEKDRDLLMVENDRRLKDKIDLKEKYVALKAENEKLKLDCEKLKHGYLDTDMIFCGGRQNGKQYTFLVELFKKIPKEKVQAAYVVAYKESLIWCTSQPSIRDQLDSLIERSKYAIPYTTEWIKPPTKREEMWNEIFAIHKEKHPIIVVKKEDVSTFLHEIENKIPEITWASGVKIFEAKGTIKDIYNELKHCDTIYFRLSKETKLSYSCDPYIYPYYEFEHIAYLPPMRWDLFKKGRIVVGVKNNNELVEFRKEVERNTGIKNIPMYPTNLCLFYSFDKDEYKIILETIEESNIAKINGHKVYYWEDVRDKTTSMEDPYDTWVW